jgi:hypothetical protein
LHKRGDLGASSFGAEIGGASDNALSACGGNVSRSKAEVLGRVGDQHHMGALPGKGGGDGPTNASACACDHNDFVVKAVEFLVHGLAIPKPARLNAVI